MAITSRGTMFPTTEITPSPPTDISLIANLLHFGNGTMLPSTDTIAFTVWRVDPVSKLPHNALADAIALREVYRNGG